MSAIFRHICAEITKRANDELTSVSFQPTTTFRNDDTLFTLRVIRKAGLSKVEFEDAVTEFALDIGEEFVLHDENLGFVHVHEESISGDQFVLSIADREPDRK